MVTGIINNIWTKNVNTKYGEKPVTLFSVESEDKTFSAGFGKQEIKEGDEVSFNHHPEKYGEYQVDKNTLKIVSRGNKVSGAPAPAPKNTGGGSKGYSRGNFPLDFTDGQRSILRQHAFTQAREFMVTEIETERRDPDDFTVEEAVALAYKIEKYTSGDDLREEMKGD